MDEYNITQLATEEVVTMTTILADQVSTGTLQGQQSRVILTIVTTLISAILSIILNTLNIMVATSRQFHFPISNCVAIVSMSSADMILGLSTIIRFALSSWTSYICRPLLIVSVTGVRVSVVSLILIIVDRYVAIVYPFMHDRYATKRFCIVLVIVTWLLTALANILENATGTYFYDPNRHICDVKLSINRALISTTLVYFIPLGTMLVIYTHLLVIVRRLIREIARIHPLRDCTISIQERGLSTDSTTGVLPGDSERPRAELQEREEANLPHENDHMGQYKVIVTFFAVTAAFTITTVPNRIVRLVSLVKGAQAVPFGATQFCRILVLNGSWMNFVIFSVMNPNFRRALKHIFKRRIIVQCNNRIL